MINNLRQIYLPPPRRKGSMSLEEAIARRRSIRRFTSEPISQSQLSQILWAAQGISDSSSKFRTVPSAGATYPLEIFVVCGRNCIEEIDEGIYHYNIDNHSLALHHKGDMRFELVKAVFGKKIVHQAPVDIIICALYQRATLDYGDKGKRYVHIEVGHAGQNIYLQVAALGLATVAIGAFNDERVREALRLEKQYKPVYIMPVGKPA